MKIASAAAVVLVWAGIGGLVAGQAEPWTRTAISDLLELSRKMPTKPERWVGPSGRYVLHGDLFRDGRHLALSSDGVMAVAGKRGWKKLGDLPFLGAWHHPEWPADDLEESAARTSEPIRLRDLDDDGVPEIVVVENTDVYHLQHRIIKKIHGSMVMLAPVSDTMPVGGRGYLVTSGSEGRKAWCGGKQYYKWVKGRPVLMAENWSDCYPGRESNCIVRYEKGVAVERFTVSFLEDYWKIDVSHSEFPAGPLLNLATGTGAPFVTLKFSGSDGTISVAGRSEAKDAYLFQKLTRLDWRIYGMAEEMFPSRMMVEELAQLKVEVKGETEAVGCFNALRSVAP